MNLLIGRLRQRITLQVSTPTQDANGEPIDAWANLGSVPTVWANIRVKPGGERFVSGGGTVQAEIIHTATIRFRADITPKMRVLIVGTSRVLLIENVYDPTGEKEYTILECREVQ